MAPEEEEEKRGKSRLPSLVKTATTHPRTAVCVHSRISTKAAICFSSLRALVRSSPALMRWCSVHAV